jgi:hypothetical protein
MTAPSLDDRSIERQLRAVLEPLDRHLEWGGTLLAAALVGVVPATFLSLWLLSPLGAKQALGWSVAAFLVVLVVGIAWDTLAARLAAWRFNRKFPEGSLAREAAMVVLAEMESPSKAEERLRASLLRSSRRVIRHRHGRGGPPADAVPAIDPAPPARPIRAPLLPPPPRRGGGYHDYIPLEPPEKPPEA